MWFMSSKPTTVSVVPIATPIIPSRLPIPSAELPEPDLESNELSEYLEVASSLGIEDAPALLEERLERFLRSENITAYDEDAVYDYLNQEFGKGKWNWAGLRQCDVDHLNDEWHTTFKENEHVYFTKSRYSGKVPLPVLLAVKKISTAFPQVNFFVSQSEAEGDPFLLVTNREIGSYVVERWDEPSFRDK